MSEEIIITVVVPTRNIVKYIQRALQSVAAQGGAWRLVGVDSVSTDGTREILEDFRKIYPDRVQILDSPRACLSEALNLGLVAAEPGWIQWIGGDDAVAPGGHALVRAALARHPNAQWLFGDSRFRDADGLELRVAQARPWDRLAMLQANVVFAAASLYTRDLAIRSGLCSPVLRRTMDYEWWFRMAALTDPVLVGGVTAEFTSREDSLSGGNNAADIQRESLHVRQMYAAFTLGEQAVVADVMIRRYLPLMAKQRLYPLYKRLRAR